jgi:hypothetical protein
MPKLGDTRVNSTDYDGDVVIEQYTYWGFNDSPGWCVPAWEERGVWDLAGPFASHAEAQEALTRYESVWDD